MNTNDNNRADNMSVPRHEFEDQYRRISQVEIDQAATREAVTAQGKTLERIESKLDNPIAPPTGPSWVAIASLVASIAGILGAVILGFIILKSAPLEKDMAAMQDAIDLDTTRAQGILEDLSKLDEQMRRAEIDKTTLFNIMSRLRQDEINTLQNEKASQAKLIEELRERVDRGR